MLSTTVVSQWATVYASEQSIYLAASERIKAGKNVIFTSGRGKGVFPSVATLWEVPVAGGIERPISTDWGVWASYSPDGSKIAFAKRRARMFWTVSLPR